MRLARGLLLSTLLISGANASDYLRGAISDEPSYQPAPQQASNTVDWSGFYVGGLASYNTGRINTRGVGSNLAMRAFPNLTVTDQIGGLAHYQDGRDTAGGYGAFVGYNMMWDDVVLGVEGEYSRTSIERDSPISPIGRRLTPSSSTTLAYNTMLTGGSVKTTVPQYGVVRLRAGWAVGQFMPYASLGVVMADARTKSTLQGTLTEYILNTTTGAWEPGGTVNANVSSKNQTVSWGYAIGAGMDVMLAGNIFVRGKYEFLSFGGSQSTHIGLHTFKAGAGVKF